MGTRNLTMVVSGGKYRVAQYCQWDGGPHGQGSTILEFLQNKMKRDMFLKKIQAVKEITQEEHKALWVNCGADPKDESGMVSSEIADKFKKRYSHLHRDTGAEILEMIQNAKPGIKLSLDTGFAADSLFCEWAYVIDFDKNTFEVYSGFNDTNLSPEDRFYFLEKESAKEHRKEQYHPVRLLAVWDLNKLPTEDSFLKTCEQEETAQNFLAIIKKKGTIEIPQKKTFHASFSAILKNRENLALLIGLDSELDEIIEKRLKKQEA